MIKPIYCQGRLLINEEHLARFEKQIDNKLRQCYDPDWNNKVEISLDLTEIEGSRSHLLEILSSKYSCYWEVGVGEIMQFGCACSCKLTFRGNNL